MQRARWVLGRILHCCELYAKQTYQTDIPNIPYLKLVFYQLLYLIIVFVSNSIILQVCTTQFLVFLTVESEVIPPRHRHHSECEAWCRVWTTPTAAR